MMILLTLLTIASVIAANIPKPSATKILLGIPPTSGVVPPAASPTPAVVAFSNMTNCTWGLPADNGTAPGSLPIYYQKVTPTIGHLVNSTSYKLDDMWFRQHKVGQMVSLLSFSFLQGTLVFVE
jgi:hypothetical protein